MSTQRLPAFTLIGLRLSGKTSNEDGRSGRDCGRLWQEFEQREIAKRIPNKLSDAVYAVYFDYEGDHTAPFAYFIGCKVHPDAPVPEGLQSLHVPEQDYSKIVARGRMPSCVAEAWRAIWQSDSDRAYGYDFEVYDERSRDWSDAEVDVFVSVGKRVGG